MTVKLPARLVRVALCLAACFAPVHIFDAPLAVSQAAAQSPDAAEKEAFEAAKELGTIAAWDAFLANYTTGFRADLARAYKQKLSETGNAPPSAAAPAATSGPNEFPVDAGTWGGIVRSGPGGNYKKQDSLSEGETVSLMGVTPELDNGYPWFKIWYGPTHDTTGYMWGGILCAKGAERADVYKTCTPEKAAEPQQKKKDPPLKCGENYKLRKGECVLQQNCGANATRSPEGDCHCNENYEMRNGKCGWKHDKQGFEIAPWKKSGCKSLQKQCSQGKGKACIQYEEKCQVN